MAMAHDDVHMQRAIELAEIGRKRVMPNPLVGCVLVRNGEIVAQGWHDHIGGLHAEQMAIADAEEKGISTHGTTAYITLEPCNHFGRTPPCTEALLWAGVKRVVIGALDPNPNVRGGGIEMLRQEGIDVEEGILVEDCEEQIAPFIHWCKYRRPIVTLKASTDSKGRIDGDPSKPSERFSSSESISLSHKIRAESMAILVGVNTVIRDDPSLTVRGPDIGPREPPLRVVIDPKNRIPRNCCLMVDNSAKTLIVQSRKFEGKDDNDHVERIVLQDEKIQASTILDMLGDRGIQSLLVEGGAETWGYFLSEGLVDMFRLCISPIELENSDSPIFTPEMISSAGLSIFDEKEISDDKIQWWKRD